VATIVIKPLSAAIRDGDTVRAVIKATLLNQDGKTATITSPSQEAQETLIRQCYANAGLDPKDTTFIEAHGTGTKAGDPVEFRALKNVFTAGRSIDLPLYLSSLKANVGHLESASGVAAVIKTALALEYGIIPPSTNFESVNSQFDLVQSNIQIPVSPTKWPSGVIKRASLNNFGYGGTNAHVIMEESPITARRTHSVGNVVARDISIDAPPAFEYENHDDKYGKKPTIPRVFVLSAKDEKAAQTMLSNLATYLSSESLSNPGLLDDLAYTLSRHRSRFSWVSAVAASTIEDLHTVLVAPESKPKYAPSVPRIGFVFNGQGAQWHAMGRELIGTYQAFTAALQKADKCVESFGADWSLSEELTRGEVESRVNEPSMSMPVCTAIQLALVELLRSWGVIPVAVTGHSSGEAAAAYSAGAISFETAMAISYFRGLLTTKYQKQLSLQGCMLAVGLGPEDAAPHLENLLTGKVVVACINSPRSVTLSGDSDAIAEVEAKLTADSIFARRLKVSAAYHSQHMLPQSAEYLTLLQENFNFTSEQFGEVIYSSPVSGKTIWEAKQLGPKHWVNNMTLPVLFAQSLANMCYSLGTPTSREAQQLVDTVIEIGPHSALAGPIRQTLSQSKLRQLGITYTSCLERNSSAVVTMQRIACTLLTKGYPVNLEQVNKHSSKLNPEILCDLPSYPWNHSKSYWMEPRINKEYRHRRHQPHDLLGSIVLGGNEEAPIWRHMITPSQLPWVRDHVVQSDLVYPGAGLIAMAIEAYAQLDSATSTDEQTFHLSNIVFRNALIIPDSVEGIEVQLRLQKRDQRLLDWKAWWEFYIESVDSNGKWQQHCSGSITRHTEPGQNATCLNIAESKQVSRSTVSPERFYESLRDLGIDYGPLFKNLTSLSHSQGVATGEIRVADTAAVMPLRYESRHVIHPTTLDALFQTAYATLPNAGLDRVAAMVPTNIDSLVVRPHLQIEVGSIMRAEASMHQLSSQSFDTSLVAFGTNTTTPAVEVHTLRCQAIGSTLGTQKAAQQLGVCCTTTWKPDFTLLGHVQFASMLKMPPNALELEAIADAKRASFYLIQEALSQLTETDVKNMEWYHKIYYDWMLHQVELAKANRISARSSKWLTASEGLKQMLIEKVKTTSVSGEMVVRIGRNLLSILRKEIAPLELMLADRLLYSYYQKALRIDRSYAQVQQLIKLYGHKYPLANILEIGGGTAGCSVPVLSALREAAGNTSPGFSHYTFTDISSGFFEMARSKLADWGSMITYKALDIESSAEDQGFEMGSFDLIVACQVLHATKSMARTMMNVHKLLRPGGKLIMVETTQDSLDVQIIFGTLPGWWLSEESERKHSPSLTVDFWEQTLKQTGYSGLDLSVRDSEDTENYSQSVILSTGLPAKEPEILSPVAIVYAGEVPPQPWMDSMMTQLARLCASLPCLVPLKEAANVINDKFCIIVDDFKQPILTDADGERFDELHSVLGKAKGILWLQEGGTIDSPQPRASLVQGLLRVLRFEDNTKRFISLDLEPGPDSLAENGVAELISVFRKCFEECSQKENVECEYAERNQTIFIPRLYGNPEQSAAALEEPDAAEPQMQPWKQGQRELRMEVGTPGMLDTLHFKEVSSTSELPDDFVEIETQAFGLNFRDIMVALGQLRSEKMGFECSGIVTRVGSHCTTVKPGDRVCALTRGDWATINRVHHSSVVEIPKNMTIETAATVPVVFVTAYYSLFDIGRLERGDSILIHSAAGGVGQAAITLAKLAGAEIYATVGSQAKRQLLVEQFGIPADHIFSSRDTSFAQDLILATDNKGVDVVLNSLSGPLLQATWRCIAKFGRFVEIGKKDMEQSKHLDMSPFGRAASFAAVDLLYLGEEKQMVVARVLGDVFKLLAEGKIQPIQPVKVFSISQIERAFRLMSQGMSNIGSGYWGYD
jgi:acyl transferase domain-containing protein/NADPH:quinone reductase-like Zn-dependent oxidoreductase/ubiquinone/menaquinone biosynthesis C-methylase UbiE